MKYTIVFSHATDNALNWHEWKLLNPVVGSQTLQ